MAQPTRKTDHKKPAITKEQRDEYNRRRREAYRRRKDERRLERETNRFTERRLHFVRVIMEQNHVSQAELAERMGVTRQAVHEVFGVSDDAKLSRVKLMLRACGCTCTVKLSVPEEETIHKKPIYEFKGDYELEDSFWKSTPERFIRYPEFIQSCPEDANLKFLADFIISTNLNLSDFCERVQFSRQDIGYAFKADDILLSRLCQIANFCQARIVWIVNNITQTQ